MTPRSSLDLVIGAAVLLVIVAGVLALLPLLGKTLRLVFGILPVVLTICAVVSCVTSRKPGNTIVLWVIIIVLAPLLGPLLWFAWGRRNT
jgi:hypothetical protein